jgi:glyoxylase-like metal-dependent hydrolase (beta-lactamase superfamily II)
VKVDELALGLWRWTAPHPDWKEGEGWEQDVGCVYYEATAATVLIDPLVPPERDLFFDALDRDIERRGLPTVILLTCKWHERSAAELAERYSAGNTPPPGIEPFPVPEIEETLWWLPEERTLVVGDVLLGAPQGIQVCPDSWLEGQASPASIRAALQPLLDRPVERILVSHGDPVLVDGRAALERALRA